MRLTFWETETA